MTKKDYELIADAFKVAKPYHHEQDDYAPGYAQWRAAVVSVADALERDYKGQYAFDRARFMLWSTGQPS